MTFPVSLKLGAVNESTVKIARGTVPYKMNGLNLPLGPILVLESTIVPTPVSTNASKILQLKIQDHRRKLKYLKYL